MDNHYFYFAAFDTNQDPSDGPVPVVQGPYWGNGWGTGPISRFVEYNNGQFWVYQPSVQLTLTPGQGSITGVQGTPSRPVAGIHTLTVETVTLGTATLSGAGNILTVTNASDQNAGVLTVITNDAGKTLVDGVSFVPAAVGGRELTADEQLVLVGLNAGGVALTNDSLAGLGLGLTVTTSAFLAGTQEIAIDPTHGTVGDTFVPAGGFAQTQSSGEVIANARSDPALSPIPGVALVAGELVVDNTSTVVAQMAPTATFLGPPFLAEIVAPDTIAFTLDLDQIDPQAQTLEANFIATDKLIIDPNSTEQKVWDALGPPQSPEFVTIPLQFSGIYNNESSPLPEEAGDCDIPSLDIVDWSLEVRLF